VLLKLIPVIRKVTQQGAYVLNKLALRVYCASQDRLSAKANYASQENPNSKRALQTPLFIFLEASLSLCGAGFVSLGLKREELALNSFWKRQELDAPFYSSLIM